MDGQPQQSTSTTPVSPTQPATSSVPPIEPSIPVQTATSPVSSTVPPTTTPIPPQKKSHTKFLLILLIFIILIIAGLVMYKVYLTKSSESMQQGAYKVSPTVTPSPTTTPAAVKSGDSQLDQQSDVIDDSMNKLTDDLKNVDQGLIDQAENLN